MPCASAPFLSQTAPTATQTTLSFDCKGAELECLTWLTPIWMHFGRVDGLALKFLP